MIAARIAALWGAEAVADFLRPSVFHVTAVWRRPEGPPAVLRINADTPKSATDRFSLEIARARADAIVATGQILRDEPEERFAIADAEIQAWRRTTFGDTPTTLAVLTSGRAIDFDHPAFHAEHLRPIVFTANARLEAPTNVEVIVDANASPRTLIAYLRRRCSRISIEAGPSASRLLYEAPLAVDELLLSTLVAERVPANTVGGDFFAEPELAARFAERSTPVVRTERGRTWRFERFSA
ncbi:MAG: hypothetical protein RMA76_23875 [Deltaproteobacteria bacterium]